MAKKIITGGNVNLIHPDSFKLVTLSRGDEVPKWAEKLITNPELFVSVADSGSDAAEQAQSDPDGANTQGATTELTPGATEVTEVTGTVAELKEQAKGLGIAQSGSKAELIDRITAKLAEDAAATGLPGETAADTAANTAAAEANVGGDRAVLEARAEELGASFDADTTDDELVAIIEAHED